VRFEWQRVNDTRRLVLRHEYREIKADSFNTGTYLSTDGGKTWDMVQQAITSGDVNGGTEVCAVHDNLPSGLSPADNETGWRMALDKLAAFVEGRLPAR
jgi:hypothetical protein